MKQIVYFLLISLIVFIGCGTPYSGLKCETIDTIYCPRHAERFLITKQKDSIYLTVKNPWQGASNSDHTYNITTPFERIITMSTSHLAFLETIGCQGRVVGVSRKDVIYSSSYDNTIEIGYDNHLEFEKILRLKPDIMFVYEIAGENTPVFNKLSTLGINIIYIADYLELSPLGRAEWVVAFGAMTGHIEDAVDYFYKIESSYNNLKDSVKHRNTKIILNSPYQDIWYFPSVESYPVQFILDAGGEYIGTDYHGNSSTPVSMETAYKLINHADIWLNPSIGTTSKKVLLDRNPALSDIDIPLFDNNKRSTINGGSDYYESGVVRPDLILKDLITIISEGQDAKDDSLYFYHQIH